jgi:hypothetical protein
MNNHYRALCALMLAAVAMTANTLCFADEPVAEPGQLDFPGQSLMVPLTGPGAHPKVVVDMGDGKQHEFIVDTGASMVTIPSSTAEELGIDLQRPERGSDEEDARRAAERGL